MVVGDKANDDVQFVFPSPPKIAKDVRVEIVEKFLNLDGRPTFPPKVRNRDGELEAPEKRFFGNIEGGKFVVSGIVGGMFSKQRNAEFNISDPEGTTVMRARIMDPERVSSHTLMLQVRHGDGDEVWNGTHTIDVRFPLAMVVPAGTAVHDLALNSLGPYARGWKSRQPRFRHVVTTTMYQTAQLPEIITQAHFNDVIRAHGQAARAATTGVVALATGHGGHGSSSSFVNLVPEDKRGMTSKLLIRKSELVGGENGFMHGTTPRNPSEEERVRLDGLDRLGDELRKAKLRRLILHTCRAGGDGEFMQLIANRLQVPVAGQKDWIWFTTDYSVYASELTAAEKANPKLRPTALTKKHEGFWLVHKLSKTFHPKKEPPRYVVP